MSCEHEHIYGLPEELPEGEEILWQGEPDVQAMARRVFHVHALAIYFAALILLHAAYQWFQGAEPGALLASASWQVPLALAALGTLFLMARAYARTTVYTITNQRLVIQSGVAVSLMINLPWGQVRSADLRVSGDGTGDIAFELAADKRIAYLALWPSARPWHFAQTQPLMRGIAAPETVAALLAKTVTGERWSPRGASATGVPQGSGGAVVAS